MGEIRASFEDQVAILTIDNLPTNCITTTKFRQLSAQEFGTDVAERWGLVDIVTAKGEAEATALSLARQIASYGPLAAANAKQAIRQSGQCDLVTGLARERDLFVQCATSADFDEGRSAFLEKRSPQFAGK